MTRRFSVLSASTTRALLAVFAVGLAVLACAASALASLTPGDVVVERDGNGGVEALTSSATPVHLDEFGPLGGLAESIALPTNRKWAAISHSPTAATASLRRGADTVGQRRMPAHRRHRRQSRHDRNVLETKDTNNPRVVAVVNGAGTVNTETALTNFANENNPRSATSSDCKKIWVGGDGTKTTGGVLATTAGRQRRDPAQRRQERPPGGGRRQPALHVSPTRLMAGDVTIATRRHRAAHDQRPDDHESAVRNLGEPEEPYAYSLLTLGSAARPTRSTSPTTKRR